MCGGLWPLPPGLHAGPSETLRGVLGWEGLAKRLLAHPESGK